MVLYMSCQRAAHEMSERCSRVREMSRERSLKTIQYELTKFGRTELERSEEQSVF